MCLWTNIIQSPYFLLAPNGMLPSNSSADERLASYTLWLTIFTGLLFIVSALQGIFIIKGEKTSRITARAAQESASTARTALEKLERPYLYVQDISNLFRSMDGTPHVPFTISNFGRTAAIIKTINAGLATSADAQPDYPLELDYNHPVLVKPVLYPGETRDVNIDMPFGLDVTWAQSGTGLPLPLFPRV